MSDPRSTNPLFSNPTIYPESYQRKDKVNENKKFNTITGEYGRGELTPSPPKRGEKMSETVIASSAKHNKKQNGVKFVNSRSGGKSEHAMTKNASIKHENPAYFKRQSDQKKSDQFGFQMKSRSRTA